MVLAGRHRQRGALPRRLLPRPDLRRAALQVVYVVVSLYGWYEWLHGGDGHGRLRSRARRRAGRAGLAVRGVAASVALGLFLSTARTTRCRSADAATTAFSLVAQWMATRKWLENWLVWIAVDVAYVGMYVSQRLLPDVRPLRGLPRAGGPRLPRVARFDARGREASPRAGDRVKPARVVLIGPECTGKTWLAGELAARYGVPSAPEHAREYVERHGTALTYADVDPIGRGQRAGEDAAIARAGPQGRRSSCSTPTS